MNPQTVGALIALYERAVGLYASLVNINAYHQPGVEAGKKAAASLLDLQRQVLQVLRSTERSLDLNTLAQQVGSPEQIESIYKIVRHLAANHRGVVLDGDRAQPSSLSVSLKQGDRLNQDNLTRVTKSLQVNR